MVDLSPLRIARCAAIICAVVIGVVVAARASTLEDYQHRLEIAEQKLDELTATDDGSLASAERIHRLVAATENAVPRSENIDLRGTSIVTDNGWLWDGLAAFEADHVQSDRDDVLDQLKSRLGSVRKAVAELVGATAGNRAKDEDRRKLAEILEREEYRLPERNDESLFRRWSRAILEWLSRMFPQVSLPSQDASGVGAFSMILQIILYVLLASGIGFLLYRFVPRILGRSRSDKSGFSGDRVILGERIGRNLSSRDIFNEAESLAREGQLRQAIRKGYIALLCELNDRRVIALAQHKTNRDYLRDLRSRKDLIDDVGSMTGEFERHWYGYDPTLIDDWTRFRELYLESVNRVRGSR